MIWRLLLAAIAGPLLLVLIAAIIEYPALLLVPAGLIGGGLLVAFIHGAATAVKQNPFPDDRLDLPPDSLTPPQPAPRRDALPPTTVPGDGADSPGHGNLASFTALRRLQARWRYRSPPMQPPAI